MDDPDQPAKLEDFCGPCCPARDREPDGLSLTELSAWRDRRKYHLMGHMLDRIAASSRDPKLTGIPQDGIEKELRHLYNEMHNAELQDYLRSGNEASPEQIAAFSIIGPEMWGCFGPEAQAELMAEAFRAYMQDPNSMKTVAPNAAARISEWVNTCPRLNKLICFN